jgi:hypothetical protein
MQRLQLSAFFVRQSGVLSRELSRGHATVAALCSRNSAPVGRSSEPENHERLQVFSRRARCSSRRTVKQSSYWNYSSRKSGREFQPTCSRHKLAHGLVMRGQLLARNTTVTARALVGTDRCRTDRYLDADSPQFACAGLKFLEISQKSVEMAYSHPSYIQARKGA